MHDLGNLAFWQGDENRLASNKPYITDDEANSKKPDLLLARAELTREAGSHDAWTPTIVRERRERLVDRLLWVYDLPDGTRAAARPANRKFWLVFHELEPQNQIYSDARGESYHFPRSIPNGSQIQEGDVLLPFCSIDGENRVFGVGLVGEIEEDTDGHKIAFYSRYIDLDPPKALSLLASDPRTNRRNAINGVSLDVFVALSGGISNLDTIPAVAGFAPVAEP